MWRGEQKESEKEVRKEEVWIYTAAFLAVVKALQTKACQRRRRSLPFSVSTKQRRYANVINHLHGPSSRFPTNICIAKEKKKNPNK